ncbi:hypothetical protein JRO89_XS14G0123300 [Xanthoceras sorbifolium]|uniref:CCHC-type domain-containing protein n=1 Tax=Xanthoceras sorbifolium TaxID=99658 RepID=A0ABQ8H529_9ROSI|nr:hypothetical protein JRO89_XS14G0123300 [Xanthoceras sorbifolium]
MIQPQAGPSRAVEGVGGNFNAEQRCTIERASKLGAKPYDGSGVPEAALLWLDRVSKIYRVMGCTDEQRVLFSSFLMEDRAKYWWEALERRHPGGEDEEQKCKRFMAGLNPRIKIHLSLAPQTHYGELVEAAMKVERNATAITQGRPDNKRSEPSSSRSGFSQTSRKKSKTKWISGKGIYRGAAFSQGSVRSPAAPGDSRPILLECSICKRRHPRECKVNTTACFHYGQEGHFIKECPQLVTTKGSKAGIDTAAPTPSTGGPRHTGRGFKTRGASIAAGRGAGGRGTRSRGGIPVGQPRRGSCT